MRLDARTTPGAAFWRVLDVPAGKSLRNVVYLDTTTRQWGAYDDPPRVDAAGAVLIHHRIAERIELDYARKVARLWPQKRSRGPSLPEANAALLAEFERTHTTPNLYAFPAWAAELERTHIEHAGAAAWARLDKAARLERLLASLGKLPSRRPAHAP